MFPSSSIVPVNTPDADAATTTTTTTTAIPEAQPPHVILVLADDFGWRNAGFRAPDNLEANTPHLDDLALNHGIILDRHYVFQYCSPSRASLLTGRLPLHVNQNNDCNEVISKSGIDLRMTLLPEKLQREGGYKTAMVGKWHGGARTFANLPHNRGFDRHFGFLKGGETHYTHASSDGGINPITDLWRDGGPAVGDDGNYSTDIYRLEALDVIEKHDDVMTPLFLYLPFQVTHSPYEVPAQYIDPSIDDDACRQTYQAMTTAMDESVGAVVDALKAKEGGAMWNNTLVIFSADNGGITYSGANGCGNNWPLRGGKTTHFEGGVRASAFIAGGPDIIPPSVVGTVNDAYIHIADWYSTLCRLAGVDPEDDGGAVPPIDSIDQWATLMGDAPPVRTEIPLAFCVGKDNPSDACMLTGWEPDSQNTTTMFDSGALINGSFKLVWGDQHGYGFYTGPIFPNGTDPGSSDPGCPDGCLFNILDDPNESVDIKDAEPELFESMRLRLVEIGRTAFQTNYSDVPGDEDCLDDESLLETYQGQLGPRCVC